MGNSTFTCYHLLRIIQLKDKRHKIGFLSSYFEGDPYSETLCWQIEHVCQSKNVDLFIFTCRNYKDISKHIELFDNVLEFVSSDCFDGLILSSSSLINYVGREYFKRRIDHSINNNMVSLSIEIDGFSSVSIDNVKGMKIIAEHLIETHNFKRFFISAAL